MKSTFDMLASVGFTQPAWLLAALPFLALIAWDLASRQRGGIINLTDLEFLREHRCIGGTGRRWTRAALWGLLALTVAALAAGPVIRSNQPLFQGGRQVVYQKFLLMLDISRSMSVPLGAEKDVTLPGQAVRRKPEAEQGEQIPRYRAARAALMDFVERFDEAQIGLILFSAEPMLARWPTVETRDRFWEILEEDIGRGVISQIQSFSSLTNTDKAIALARQVFGRQGETRGAVILISDAEDDIEHMGVAARNLRGDGIRLYTIGVGISEQIAEKLRGAFAGDPGFRIFHVDSEAEMQEAYRLVAEVEESLPFEMRSQEFVYDLRWLFALGLVVLAAGMLYILERAFHQTRSSQAAAGSRNGP